MLIQILLPPRRQQYLSFCSQCCPTVSGVGCVCALKPLTSSYLQWLKNDCKHCEDSVGISVSLQYIGHVYIYPSKDGCWKGPSPCTHRKVQVV